MDEKFTAILDSLPPKPPRSKLEPYAELIRELRKRSRSYRDIASILKDRCDLTVGVHTLYAFVRTRSLGTAAMDQQADRDGNIIGDDQKWTTKGGHGRNAGRRASQRRDARVPPGSVGQDSGPRV